MHTTSSPVVPKYSWDRENSIMSSRRVITTRPPKWGQGRDYLGTATTKAGMMSTAPAASVCYGGSYESDDLQAMVHDFIENDPLDFMEGGDSEAPSPGKKLIETLQMRTATLNGVERELLTEVKLRLLSIKEDSNFVCCEPEGVDCKGVCVKRFVVKNLKAAGYDAAVCMSKWLSSGRVPGGEYEYIDVVFNADQLAERLIVDVDFQAQFEIARPSPQYLAALKILPAVFVGSSSKLKKILEFMSEAAKVSLKQSQMHLPPWRTLDYMSSKWLSTSDREIDTAPLSPPKRPRSFHWQPENKPMLAAKQCSEQLRHTKVALMAEMKASGVLSKRCSWTTM